jgi:predicted AAA+ superfamily ATPase
MRGYEPHYDITERGYEIDFTVTDADGGRQAIQVCADPSAPETLEREVRALSDVDRSAKTLLITLYKEDRVDVDGRTITVLPAWKWFLGHG